MNKYYAILRFLEKRHVLIAFVEKGAFNNVHKHMFCVPSLFNLPRKFTHKCKPAKPEGNKQLT